MQRHGIPTASYATFSGEDFLGAKAYLDDQPIPIVIKASGLAAGKGAVVCHERADAEATLREMMIDRHFGAATDEVVIEAFMEGEEVSVFVLTDGDSYQLLAPAQDHKAALDGDLGPNTGGMGAYAPAPVLTPALRDRVISEIIEPVLEGMARENAPYQGILYVGLMITAEGPKVVEFNCRFGDPEAQVLIPLVAGNWVEIFHDMAQGKLHRIRLAPPSLHAATVVMASGGYPGSYEKGFPISGLNKVGDARDLIVFHAGTKRAEDGTIVTAGGRVLSVTGMGSTLRGAIDKAYEAVAEISFRDAYFRTDIGHRALTS
jgi:phosphoribosylamine--glycine ligase